MILCFQFLSGWNLDRFWISHFLRQIACPMGKSVIFRFIPNPSHYHLDLRELKALDYHPLNSWWYKLLTLNREFCPLICFSLNTLIYVMGLSKIFLPVICALGYLCAINSLKYEKIASVRTSTTETDGPTANTFGLLQHRISSLRNCYITHKMYSAAIRSRWNRRAWQWCMMGRMMVHLLNTWHCSQRCIFHLRKVSTVLSPCLSLTLP